MPERELPPATPRLAGLAKWGGVALGPLAWIVDQQLVSISSYATCPEFDRAFAVSVGAICAALAIAGMLISARARRRLRRRPELSSSSADVFIAAGSIGVAAISLLAILFGTAASVVLQCQR